MWSNHQVFYQDHMNYVRNDIVKPFKFKIIRYSERVREMHDLEKYLPPPSMKGDSEMAANWNFHNKEFAISDIQLSIKDRLPKNNERLIV